RMFMGVSFSMPGHHNGPGFRKGDDAPGTFLHRASSPPAQRTESGSGGLRLSRYWILSHIPGRGTLDATTHHSMKIGETIQWQTNRRPHSSHQISTAGIASSTSATI